MEDIRLIYPDFEEVIVLNYFKGTVIKNNKNAKFFFENNVLKIKWDDKKDIEDFIIYSKLDENSQLSITSYIYSNNDSNNNSLITNNITESLTSIFIEDPDFEDYFFIKNYYITNKSNTYKGVYSFKEDFLIIKWENQDLSKVYFTEFDNSTKYYLRDTYENYTTMINIDNIEYPIIINYINKKLYNNDNIYKPIGYYVVENEAITLHIKNNKYIYECPHYKLCYKYYYAIDFFTNGHYQNIILDYHAFIYDIINNKIFDKYNKDFGDIFYNIIKINNKFIINNKIYENLYIDDLQYYEVTTKYNESIYIYHESWEENCIINRYIGYFYRLSSNEKENMKINNNYLIVYWEKWNPELFICIDNSNNIYRHFNKFNFLINSNTYFEVIHSDWKDTCKIDNFKIIRSSNNDYGDFTIIHNSLNSINSQYNNGIDINKIIINWDKWGNEVYYILNNILYFESFIYFIYRANDNNLIYLLNTYNNQLFECDSNIIYENVILDHNKLFSNGIIYFYKKNDNMENNSICIHKDYFENKILVKESEICVTLNILTNEINYNDSIGNYFFEKNDLQDYKYLNIYWVNSEYNEIYELYDDGKYYYKKYLDYSEKTFYIINNSIDVQNNIQNDIQNNVKYKIDYFKQIFYNYENQSIRFLKNKNGDKFYLLLNDEIKEFCMYTFDINIIFLLDYKYNYLNDNIYSRFSPSIYKAFLKNNDLNIDPIRIFKIWLEQNMNTENNNIYSIKTFLRQFSITHTINILEKDIVKWYKGTGNLITIYEKNEHIVTKDIIIMNIDDYESFNKINKYDCDILINFNITALKTFDFTSQFIQDLIDKYPNIIYTISYNLVNYYILHEINKYVNINYENIFYFNKNITINIKLDSCFINYNKILIKNTVKNNSIYKIKNYNYSTRKKEYFIKLYDICYSNIDLIQLLIFYYILNIDIYRLGNNNLIIKNELFNHIFS